MGEGELSHSEVPLPRYARLIVQLIRKSVLGQCWDLLTTIETAVTQPQNRSSCGRLDQGRGFEKGFDPGEELGEAIGLGDDGGYPKGGGERLAENVVEH